MPALVSKSAGSRSRRFSFFDNFAADMSMKFFSVSPDNDSGLIVGTMGIRFLRVRKSAPISLAKRIIGNTSCAFLFMRIMVIPKRGLFCAGSFFRYWLNKRICLLTSLKLAPTRIDS